MASPPDISLCVPVWKRHPPPNLRTIASGLEAALAGLQGELIVVLNGISAESAHVPAGTTVVDLGRNRGIPVAWNMGAARAAAPVVCFVNDDVELGPGALRLLWEALRANPDAGVVGPEGTLFDFARRRNVKQVETAGLPTGQVRECDHVTGFLFATPRNVLERAAGFDEAYTPCWFEDVDYCTTVRLVLGLRCYVVAGVPHRHEAGVSYGRPWQRIRYDGKSRSAFLIGRRNSRYFAAKWGKAVGR